MLHWVVTIQRMKSRPYYLLSFFIKNLRIIEYPYIIEN